MANTTQVPAQVDIPAPPNAAAFNFKAVLQRMIQQNASDLHLKVGRPPVLRINGDLSTLDVPPLRPEDLKVLAEQILTPKQVKEFEENKEVDFAFGVPGIARFRANFYQQRGTIALCAARRCRPGDDGHRGAEPAGDRGARWR